jgi:aquaporin Z
MRKYITELIGTFFLVLAVCLTGGNYLAPIGVGCLLATLIYMGYNISGAHYNPATTLAVLISGKISIKDSLWYILFQFIGSFAAAYFFFAIWGRNIGVPRPNMEINILKPFALEMVFTFILILIILFVATSKKTAGNSYYGIAIGLTMVGLSIAGAFISGAAFNPAIAAGPILTDVLFGTCKCNASAYAWIYFTAPFIGSAAAAFTFRYLSPEDFNIN